MLASKSGVRAVDVIPHHAGHTHSFSFGFWLGVYVGQEWIHLTAFLPLQSLRHWLLRLLYLYRQSWTVLMPPNFEVDLKVSWTKLWRRFWRNDSLYALGDRLRCVRWRWWWWLRAMHPRGLLLSLWLLLLRTRVVFKLKW